MFNKTTLQKNTFNVNKIVFLLFLAPLFFLVACSSGSGTETTSSISNLFSSKPLPHKEVALAFIENLAKGKLKAAKKYSTEASATIIDLAAKNDLGINPDAKYSIVSDTVAGKRALVQLIEIKKDAMTEWYDLVMVDNEWKVDLYKTTERNEKIRRSKKLKKQREEEKEFYNKLHSKSFTSYKEKE